jgi:RalA-binding protein 1
MTSNESSRLLAHHRDTARDHRSHTVSLPVRAAPTSPLALIEPSSYRSIIAAPAVPSPHQPSSPAANRNAQVHGSEIIVESNPYVPDRVRVPDPAKRATPDPQLDEIREAATADALKEEIAEKDAAASQAQTHSRPIATLRTVSEPFLSGVSLTKSPPSSPSMSTSSRPSRQEPPATMPRTTSIDSTVSSISSVSASHRTPGAPSYRVSEGAGPQDIASVIAAAGSPEAAIQKLLSDKSSAASHNAQLWRLVEKQRAMILGLNRDLEKSMKEKDRYRKKLKESLVQSSSAPALTGSSQLLDDAVVREDSQSPALPEQKRSAVSQSVLRDGSLDSPESNGPSDSTSSYHGRADTPLDASKLNLPTSPSKARSAASANMANAKLDQADNATTSRHAVPGVSEATAPPTQIIATTRSPPTSPRTPELSHGGHQHSFSISSAVSPTGAAPSFSGAFKGASRKAPPAPLNLSPKPKDVMTTHIVDASESEYEEEPEKIRASRDSRGRRKTREDDDRERETLAREEEEHRSKSKKSKQGQSKSKSLPPKEAPAIAMEKALPPTIQGNAAAESAGTRERVPTYQPSGDPAAILSHRAVAENPGILQRHVTAPSLMSPGLPMSPRPGDRPPNSPMPRAPNKALNSMPLSPRMGTAGLPLSPRPPKQPIPMPPQTPMSFASPHLARAEAYHHAAQASQSSIGSQQNSTPDPSPEQDRPSFSSDPRSPGEVFKGLVTDQYPGLLLPPNALPSIFVKTASSRMKPSRQSYMAPKHLEENPVFTLAIHARSDGKQLWRVEKSFAAMATLNQQIRLVTTFHERLPDRSLFAGHAPAKIDARRQALDAFFERMLDAIQDERAAHIVCKFLSAEAFESEPVEYFPARRERRPDTPVGKGRTRREGYLTKRGKNFGGWKARYFVLDGPNLKYFEAPGGAQLGSIKLQNAQIGKQSPGANNSSIDDEENQFRHAFLILEPKRKDSSSLVRHVLCAESDGERDLWVDALLQYVDWRDEGEEFGRGVPITKADISAPRSPKASRSFNELRPSSQGPDATRMKYLDPMRSVGYESTIAGEAPVMGPPGARVSDTPSPPYDVTHHSGTSSGASEQSFAQHPTISGPSNAHVIQNSGQWGMKPPPTPGFQKDKKRGLFGFRGRTSSDYGPDKPTPPGSNPDTGVRVAFGVPLAESIEAAQAVGVNTELPAVMYRCIEYLTFKDAIAEEGIFRLSGSNTVIKALRERFNTEGDVDLVEDQKNYDIHAVASLLKLYLRELPASILTRELHLDFLHCLELNPRDRIIKLNVLVNRLPRPNRVLLEALSEFLSSIVNNAEVNKMNVRNGKFPSNSRCPGLITNVLQSALSSHQP